MLNRDSVGEDFAHFIKLQNGNSDLEEILIHIQGINIHHIFGASLK